MLFNHLEADFAVKHGGHVEQMNVQVILTPEVFEVEVLDAIVRGKEDSGTLASELQALVDTSREVICLGWWWTTRGGTSMMVVCLMLNGILRWFCDVGLLCNGRITIHEYHI